MPGNYPECLSLCQAEQGPPGTCPHPGNQAIKPEAQHYLLGLSSVWRIAPPVRLRNTQSLQSRSPAPMPAGFPGSTSRRLAQPTRSPCPVKRSAASRSRSSRRTVSSCVPMVCLDTAAIRYVHSTTPVIEWLMPDRLEKSAFAFHPLKGSVPGKREHDK